MGLEAVEETSETEQEPYQQVGEKMKRYKVCDVGWMDVSSVLNEMAEQGWELHTMFEICPNPTEYKMVFEMDLETYNRLKLEENAKKMAKKHISRKGL